MGKVSIPSQVPLVGSEKNKQGHPASQLHEFIQTPFSLSLSAMRTPRPASAPPVFTDCASGRAWMPSLPVLPVGGLIQVGSTPRGRSRKGQILLTPPGLLNSVRASVGA